MHTGFWWAKPEGKTSLIRPRCRWDDVKMDLKKWTGLLGLIICIRKRDKGQAVLKMVMNCGFHKMWEVS
jgi:hypothetical protein